MRSACFRFRARPFGLCPLRFGGVRCSVGDGQFGRGGGRRSGAGLLADAPRSQPLGGQRAGRVRARRDRDARADANRPPPAPEPAPVRRSGRRLAGRGRRQAARHARDLRPGERCADRGPDVVAGADAPGAGLPASRRMVPLRVSAEHRRRQRPRLPPARQLARRGPPRRAAAQSLGTRAARALRRLRAGSESRRRQPAGLALRRRGGEVDRAAVAGSPEAWADDRFRRGHRLVLLGPGHVLEWLPRPCAAGAEAPCDGAGYPRLRLFDERRGGVHPRPPSERPLARHRRRDRSGRRRRPPVRLDAPSGRLRSYGSIPTTQAIPAPSCSTTRRRTRT